MLRLVDSNSVQRNITCSCMRQGSHTSPLQAKRASRMYCRPFPDWIAVVVLVGGVGTNPWHLSHYCKMLAQLK